MAPQKNKPTGYSIFVNEVREQYKKRGEYFPKKTGDAFIFVGPLWQKLSEDEKKKYNDKAKHEKRLGASDLESKFNSMGFSYAAIDAEKREKEEYHDIMMNTIKNTISQSDIKTTLITQKFYLCHVNFFYVNSSGNFKPAEIALSEFNLQRGVLSTFHAFINPGPVETGYRFDAKRKLEETHKIPIDDPTWTCGERDYVNLYSRIKLFLTKDNPNGRIPPVYTMPDDEKNNFSISAVKNTIENLCEAANEEPSEFRIYELPYLYHELRLKVITESPCKPDPLGAQYHTLSMALYDLEKDKFCYTKGIACDFHEKADRVHFCSQSVVTRLVFTMCDFLLNYLPVDLVEGGHAPKCSLNANEVYHRSNQDEDDIVPLRRPQINLQTNSSNNGFKNKVEPIRPTSQPSGITPPHPSASSVRSQPLVVNDVEVQDDVDENDDTPISIYKDGASSLPTPNMSQNTILSGYTASASLSQSSYASEISVDTFPYLGRGRGVPCQQVPAPNMNWAMVAGRGSRLRSQQQNQ